MSLSPWAFGRRSRPPLRRRLWPSGGCPARGRIIANPNRLNYSIILSILNEQAHISSICHRGLSPLLIGVFSHGFLEEKSDKLQKRKDWSVHDEEGRREVPKHNYHRAQPETGSWGVEENEIDLTSAL